MRPDMAHIEGGPWVYAAETDLKGEAVAVEKAGGRFYVQFYDGKEHVEEVGPLGEAEWLHLVSRRFADKRLPEGLLEEDPCRVCGEREAAIGCSLCGGPLCLECTGAARGYGDGAAAHDDHCHDCYPDLDECSEVHG